MTEWNHRCSNFSFNVVNIRLLFPSTTCIVWRRYLYGWQTKIGLTYTGFYWGFCYLLLVNKSYLPTSKREWTFRNSLVFVWHKFVKCVIMCRKLNRLHLNLKILWSLKAMGFGFTLNQSLSSATEILAKFQSFTIIFTPNLAASRLHEIWR